MSSIKELNFSYFYMLIFTVISSFLAYHIVVTAYENAYVSDYTSYESSNF